MSKKIISIITLVFTALTLFAQQERGNLIFADDFNTQGTFLENWKIVSGVKNISSEGGVVTIDSGGVLVPRCDIPDEFYLTVKLTLFEKRTKTLSFAGVFLGGNLKCMIRSDGKAWLVYNIPDEKRSRGAIKQIEGFEFGKSNELTLIRKKQGDGALYIYRINGVNVGQAALSMHEKNQPPRLVNAHNEKIVFDDFNLFSLKKDADSSPNLAVNSSFEQLQEGMPTFFDTDTLRNFSYKTSYEEYLKTFTVDTTEKYSGKQSLKLIFNESTWQQGFQSFDTGIIVGQPVTYSVHLKADQDDYPARLSIWEMRTKWHHHDIRITKEWQRYTFTLPAANRPMGRFGLKMNKPGTVWVDDLQVEIGSEATTYKISDIDKQKFAPVSELPPPQKFSVPKLKVIPAMDGNIDAWKKHAFMIDHFYHKNESAKTSTFAYLGCDNDNLYIGVRAKVDDMAKIKMNKTDFDNFSIFSNDNIEILLDPGHTKANHFQFVVSASNSRLDMGRGRNQKWNGNWNSAVKLNEKEKSIDYEVQIPLSTVTNALAGGNWGINIGRFAASNGEPSCIMPITGQANFHKVEDYPIMQLPTDILKNYATGITAARISPKDNRQILNAEINNLTGRNLKGQLKASNMIDGKQLGEAVIELKPELNHISLNLSDYNVKNTELNISFSANGKLLFNQNMLPEVSAPLKFYSKYNYYMNDPQATFRVETTLPEPEKLSSILTCGDKTLSFKTSDKFFIELPLADLPEGKHEVTLTLQDSDKAVVAKATAFLTKKAYRKGATRINHYLRCLENDGKPIFPFAPLLSIWKHNKNSAVQADFLHKYGFKYAQLVISRDAVDASLPFLDRAQELGMKVIYWNHWIGRNQKKSDEELQKDIAKLEKYDNIIAHLVIDEPELYMKSAETRDLLTRMRKFFPYQPTFMNNTVIGIPNRFADLNTDILMLDDYLTNKENRTVKEIVNQSDIMWKAGEADNLPCYYFLIGNNMHNHYREPTAAEQYAETYGCLAANCTGFSYFMGIPSYPEHWKAYLALNKEIITLNDIILSEEETAPALVSDASFRHITRRHQGYLYVIAVNIEQRKSMDVFITLPAGNKYDSEVEVMFENRKIKIKNGKLTDDFDGYSRHVYKIKIK